MRINMKPEEAKDILSDMRDQHLCFLESSENKDEWQKKYLKEAWACDSGAKALEKQIPCKPEEYVPDFPYNIFSTQKCGKCGSTENLELHHMIPASLGGTNDENNLIWLCNKCHKKVTQYQMNIL